MVNLSFTAQDVAVSQESDAYEGFFRIKKIKLRYKQFAGGWGNDHVMEQFDRNPVAAVLPYDPILDQVVLIEQFRIGCLGDQHPWLLELVAGIIEPGETATDMALRETKEEAGLSVSELHKMYEYWTSPGGSNEYLSLFCGVVDASQAGGLHGTDPNEDIKVHALDAQTAFDMLAQGQIRNAATIVALQWLQLHRQSLFHRSG